MKPTDAASDRPADSWSIDSLRDAPDTATPPGGLIHAASLERKYDADATVILTPHVGPVAPHNPQDRASTEASRDER